uniref:Germin-like protein n=1 Tax=Solanum tuberosum TaxID=4113 RepID=M1DF14_SOLTU
MIFRDRNGGSLGMWKDSLTLRDIQLKIDTLYVGFLVPDPANFFKSRLFSKILNPGDVFVFPIGLIHFLYNVGHKKAVVFGTYNSQNPGLIAIPSSIFASEPPIMDDILAKGFQLNKTEIAQLGKKYS